jgi:hypothetical protein
VAEQYQQHPGAPAPRLTRRAALAGGAAAAALVGVGGPRALAQPAPSPASPDPTGSTGIIETRDVPRWTTDGEAPLGEDGLAPFAMVAMTAPGLAGGGHAQLRVLTPTGWGPWSDLHGEHGTDHSDLVWVADATGYQIRGVDPAAGHRSTWRVTVPASHR